MALSQPLLASSGGELQDRSIGRFIGVHLQDGGAAFRELDADLHFMEGRNQGCPLGTELDPDLLFKPSTIHGSLLLTARRPEEPKRYPSRPRNSFAHLTPSTPRSPGPNRRMELPQGNTCTKQARRVFPGGSRPEEPPETLAGRRFVAENDAAEGTKKRPSRCPGTARDNWTVIRVVDDLRGWVEDLPRRPSQGAWR